MLNQVQKRRLEREMARELRVVFVSQSAEPHEGKTRVRYRPDFLPAAIKVSSVLSEKGEIEPMTEAELSREGVDVLIYMGAGIR